MSENPYLANVSIFAGNFAPRSWAFCNGALINIAVNSALFSLIGTTYGGDGENTFALPDLRGRLAVHPNTSMVIGEIAGSENITLTSNNLPIHSHTITSATGAIPASSSVGDNTPVNAVPATPGSNLYGSSADGFGMGHTDTTGNTPIAGGNLPISIVAPYLAMNYVIAVEGIYPSRN